ncbi:hypothetical protein V6N13_085970 [Hibiscus sabdariffa]|uniref:Uncharacterized protein n=1 Tax=Hibiscus sabdariffa TaxID=183260 RepID=A0ABR2FS32_9ROSI
MAAVICSPRIVITCNRILTVLAGSSDYGTFIEGASCLIIQAVHGEDRLWFCTAVFTIMFFLPVVAGSYDFGRTCIVDGKFQVLESILCVGERVRIKSMCMAHLVLDPE